jgi:uncharacterized protein (DUF1697 family)
MKQQYLALLRGINVGGKNLIKVTDLKACFEKHGFEDTSTYIQSGNVLFASDETGQVKLTDTIERMLSQTFNYRSRVIVVPLQQLKEIIAEAPGGFGAEPETRKYDVIFLKPPLTPTEAMQSVETREGVDRAWPGHHALYFARLTAELTQTRLSRLTSKPAYQQMTIRTWGTVNKLAALLEARA